MENENSFEKIFERKDRPSKLFLDFNPSNTIPFQTAPEDQVRCDNCGSIYKPDEYYDYKCPRGCQ